MSRLSGLCGGALARHQGVVEAAAARVRRFNLLPPPGSVHPHGGDCARDELGHRPGVGLLLGHQRVERRPAERSTPQSIAARCMPKSPLTLRVAPKSQCAYPGHRHCGPLEPDPPAHGAARVYVMPPYAYEGHYQFGLTTYPFSPSVVHKPTCQTTCSCATA